MGALASLFVDSGHNKRFLLVTQLRYADQRIVNLLLNLKDSYFEPAVGSPPNFARMCGYRPY